eukprot:Tbor_TRINITY_DN5288_c1_g6::TRINITY_DN5288_c1_g6_i3::g.16351::m.16351/K02891/RP-L22e, RPL22; large subunit ribosomal protein L22e
MVAIRKKVGSRGFIRSKPLDQGKKLYKIDVSIPARDEIMDKETVAKFLTFMQEKIKLHGQTKKLGDKVKLSIHKDVLMIQTTMKYRKSYFKYLTKKFLKAKGLREYLRILAKGKQQYQLRYFNIADQEEAQ